MFCNMCGNKLVDDAKFCNICGAKVVTFEKKEITEQIEKPEETDTIEQDVPQMSTGKQVVMIAGATIVGSILLLGIGLFTLTLIMYI